MKYKIFRVWIICLLSLCWNISFGQIQQDPMVTAILGQVSKKYKSYKSISADFVHTINDNKGKLLSKTKGKLLCAGQKFNLSIGKEELMCDGKTIWSLLHAQKEVNISDYSPEDGEITPTTIYTIYEKGYKYIMIGELKGKDGRIWQAIDLEPTSRESQVTKIKLFIDKKKHTLNRWVVYERGSNNRHTWQIERFSTNPAINPGKFSFNKADYPNFKIIDLR